MQALANLGTFASLVSQFPDALFFRTHENPTAVNIENVDKRPPSWEHVAFEGACPDTEEGLGFPKGQYLIFFSEAGKVAMFYRVRGAEGGTANPSILKSAYTMMDRLERKLDEAETRLQERDAIAAELARKLEKEKKKKKKLKKKLEETGENQIGDFIEIAVTTIFDRLGIRLDTGEGGTTTGQNETKDGEFYDENP